MVCGTTSAERSRTVIVFSLPSSVPWRGGEPPAESRDRSADALWRAGDGGADDGFGLDARRRGPPQVAGRRANGEDGAGLRADVLRHAPYFRGARRRTLPTAPYG